MLFLALSIITPSAMCLVCDGKMTKARNCNVHQCPTTDKSKLPVDGVWGEWEEWSACSCVGLRQRSRSVKSFAKNGGKIPSGPEVETISCVPSCHENEAHPCKLSEWSDWSKCDRECGGGQQFKTRSILNPTINCGKTCENDLKETRGCNLQACDSPVSCEYSKWSDWSKCDKDCGGGQQVRTRHIQTHASAGGIGCTDPLTELRGCNDHCCADKIPIDCEWGEWSDFSACTKECGGGGEMSRDRSLVKAPRNGGAWCDSRDTSEVISCGEKSCNPIEPVDARWGPWTKWSACSKECGGGFQSRSRSPINSALHGGAPLEGDSAEYRSCNLQSCNLGSVDCAFSEWSDWSDCSCECNGHKSRHRRVQTYAVNGGSQCNGPEVETTSCNVASAKCAASLPHVDCVFSEWSDWSNCSVDCDGGDSFRSRLIKIPASNRGKPCVGATREVQTCNTDPCCKECAKDQSCVWGEWAKWSKCSVDCGGGEQYRHRSILIQGKNGGIECDPKSNLEVEKCNMHECHAPQYCVWGDWEDWTECSAKCDGGTQTAARRLVKSLVKPDEVLEA